MRVGEAGKYGSGYGLGTLRSNRNPLWAGIAAAAAAMALWAGLAQAESDAAQRRELAPRYIKAVSAQEHVPDGAGEARSRSEGSLEVRVKDHRNAIDDFCTLDLSFGALRLAPEPGMKSSDPGWLELAPLLDRMDLTRYKDDAAAATVYRGRLRPRRFASVDLQVTGVRGVLAKTGEPVPVRNGVGPIRLEFEVKPGRAAMVVLDLEVLDLSDHPGRGYELLLKGYEIYEDDRLLERVPPG